VDQETHCFNNVTEQCNGKRDCKSSLDEDCGKCGLDEYACHSGEGCYKIHQHCDKKADCSDYFDEMACGELIICNLVCTVNLHPQC
jgi:hypothetical protein